MSGLRPIDLSDKIEPPHQYDCPLLCGARVFPGWNYCPNCGAALNWWGDEYAMAKMGIWELKSEKNFKKG